MTEISSDLAGSSHIHDLLESEDRQSVSYAACLPGHQEPQVLPPPNKPPEEEKARQFPFPLDPFQEIACSCLHKEESVMVAAHTSAGKTVVAQYAIAMALKKNQRVIYTTPVKALSNQKFRDLGAAIDQPERQASIGLMTGDVTVNPEASCLVMTTEILRSMLYRGSNELREVSWVVFDEVHYLRDKERGVVWEESIILLPPAIKLVFLSATVPNAAEFAQWVAELKQLPCHVISTDFRPTPLQHYMFPAGGQGLYLLLNRDGKFLEENFKEMMSTMDPIRSNNSQERRRLGKELPDIQKVVTCVVEEGLQPAIVFTFSRKECEALAIQLARNKDLKLSNETERENIRNVYDNAIGTLSDVDKDLPQIRMILPLLLAGVGVHHSGMLPILREIIEILFQEGVIKVLFATETFALGLNMPAKTCIFSNCRKFDGQEQRWITSAEYIQMAGRAGRRGIDDKGIVIMMFDQRLEPETAKEIISGKPASLNSTFHLGYTMLLNAMMISGVDPEGIISQSFHQFQKQLMMPSMNKRIDDLKKELNSIDTSNFPDLEDFCQMHLMRSDLYAEVAKVVSTPSEALQYLCPGRLVHIVEEERDWGWGVVLGFQKRNKAQLGEVLPHETTADRYVVDVLLPGMDNGAETSQGFSRGMALEPCNWRQWVFESRSFKEFQTPWSPFVVKLLLSTVRKISGVKLYMTSDMMDLAAQEKLIEKVYETVKSFPDSEPPLLHAMLDPTRVQPEVVKNITMISALGNRIKNNSWHSVHENWRRETEGSHATVTRANDQPSQPERRAQDEAIEEGEAGKGEGGGDAGDGLTAGQDEKKESMAKCKRKLKIQSEIENLRKKSKQSTVHGFKDELRKRMRVLRRLQYATEDNVVTVKGRAACAVPICEDLVLVEMMFKGAFNDVAPEDIAAIVSVQIAEEKDSAAIARPKHPKLVPLLKILKDTRREVCEIEVTAGLRDPGPPEQMNTSFMELFHIWCKGSNFCQLCEVTTLFEGSIIRTMRRLAELLKQLTMSADAIGDKNLEEKFDLALKSLHRGVPFSSSLYT